MAMDDQYPAAAAEVSISSVTKPLARSSLLSMMMMTPMLLLLLLLLFISSPPPAHSFHLPQQHASITTTTLSCRRATATTTSIPLNTATATANTATITIPTTTSSHSEQQQQQQQPTVVVAVTIRQATLPDDLPSIQACRRSAYPNNKNVDTLLSAAKSFCNADQIQRPGYICFVATTKIMAAASDLKNNNIDCILANTTINQNERRKEEAVVLGTADYNINTGIVNNVYVRDYARKNGLAELMMRAVESYHHRHPPPPHSATSSSSGKRPPLKLTVASSNIPAISLYKKLGFQAKGVYGVLDGLSSAIPALNFLMEMEKK